MIYLHKPSQLDTTNAIPTYSAPQSERPSVGGEGGGGADRRGAAVPAGRW